ncbi:hypothetical protein ILYODFUR_037025 [Ilyodon furcidens]|uniref:Uncharacterized protein n=1 Tax=Ilyodon furcidens TaxID=33524 RepID=A0ABV0UQX6_9TELE
MASASMWGEAIVANHQPHMDYKDTSKQFEVRHSTKIKIIPKRKTFKKVSNPPGSGYSRKYIRTSLPLSEKLPKTQELLLRLSKPQIQWLAKVLGPLELVNLLPHFRLQT